MALTPLAVADDQRSGGIQNDATQNHGTPAPSAMSGGKQSANYYRALCNSSDEEKNRDLCQQWRMAEAAEKQARWTKRLFGLTVVEIGALVASLCFTAWAAMAAGLAARAANRSVELTEQTAKRQLRAYLLVDKAVAELDMVNHRVIACVTLKNSGQTPAYEMKAGLETWFCAPGTENAPLQVREEVIVKRADIGAGCSFLIRQWMEASEHQIAQMHAGSAIFMATGEVTYLDVFKVPQRLKMRAFGRKIGGSWVLAPTTEGNSSS
jgi:hypothetical protein